MADLDDNAFCHRIPECFVKAVGIIRKRRGGDYMLMIVYVSKIVDVIAAIATNRRVLWFESGSGSVFGFMLTLTLTLTKTKIKPKPKGPW